MNETNQTTANQIDWRELHMAKFKLGFDDDKNTIHLSKGKKAMTIQYDFGSDLYNVEKISWKDIMDVNYNREMLKGIYCDQLKEMISDFFRFEYVMQYFRNSREDSLMGAIQRGDQEKINELHQRAKNGETIRLT